MILYKRHKQGCQHKNGSGKDKNHSHRCLCSVWVEWNADGKQNRKPIRDAAGQPTSSWTDAENLASQNIGQTGSPAIATKASATTVADAIASFLKHKDRGWSSGTKAKAKLTLQSLQAFCDSQGITMLPVTLQIHHACFNKRCLNTDHYQRVTYQEHAEIHKLYDKFQRMPGFMPHFVDGQFVGVSVEL